MLGTLVALHTVSQPEVQRDEADRKEGGVERIEHAPRWQHLQQVEVGRRQRAVAAQGAQAQDDGEGGEEGVGHAPRRADGREVEVGGRQRALAGVAEALALLRATVVAW